MDIIIQMDEWIVSGVGATSLPTKDTYYSGEFCVWTNVNQPGDEQTNERIKNMLIRGRGRCAHRVNHRLCMSVYYQ